MFSEVQQMSIDEARPYYENFFEQFPTAVRFFFSRKNF